MSSKSSFDEFEDPPSYQGDELLGFQINFDDLRGRVWFPISNGLTLMYGKNGSGKTQILNSIKMALSGVRPGLTGFFQEREIQIVIRCAEADGQIFGSLVFGLFKHLESEYNSEMDISKVFNGVCEELGLDPVEIDDEWFKSGDSYLFGQFIKGDWYLLAKLYVLSLWMMHPSPGQLEPEKHENSPEELSLINGLIREISENRIAILTPTGSIDTPQWKLNLGADTFDGTSARGVVAAETELAWSKWLFDNMDRDGAFRGIHDHGEFLEYEGTDITRAIFAKDMGYGNELRSRFLSIQFYSSHGEEQFVDEIPFCVLDLNEVEALPSKLSRIALEEFGDSEFGSFLNELPGDSPQDVIHGDLALHYSAIFEAIPAINALGVYVSDISVQPSTTMGQLAERSFFEIQVTDSRMVEVLIPYSKLSKAQQRAIDIMVAIELAKGDKNHCVVVVGDEIDQSFHETAASALYAELQKIALPVVAVTHSFQALVGAGGKKQHVSFSYTGLKNSQFTSSDIAEAARDLGVSKSSLLGLTNLFVIVEGEHDQIVVEEIIASANMAAGLRIQVLPMRGTENVLRILDSRLLQYSDARVIVVADNDMNGAIEGRIKTAKAAAESGLETSLIKSMILGAKSPNDSQEVKQLTNLIIDAVEKGMLYRLSVFGMSKGDIVEYLPVESFGLQGTWEQMRTQHVQWASGLKPKSTKDFKTFLRTQLKGRIDSGLILESAQNLDWLHPDFVALLSEIRILSDRNLNV